MLVGGLAIVAWLWLAGADKVGWETPAPTAMIWVAAVVGSMHFAMSYRLAYHHGRTAIRRHPVVLAWSPITLGLCLIVAGSLAAVGRTDATEIIRAGVSVVYLLTMWHYIKQAYGVVRLGGRLRGFSLSRGESLAIRYGLYPLWFGSVLAYVNGATLVDVQGFEVRTDLLRGSVGSLRLGLVALSAFGLLGVFVHAAVRLRRLPPAMMTAPCVAAILWVGMTPSLLAAVILLPAFHALQYLACCWPAQQALLDMESPARVPGRLQLFQIFAAAACAGLLITRWLPNLVGTLGWPAGGTQLLVVLFVFLNLHHYLIDATIWRSRGELVGLLVADLKP